MVPRTAGGYSLGAILSIEGNQAIVEFTLGATYRGQINPNPDEVGVKIIPTNKLVPIPDRRIPKIPIGQYLKQSGTWEIGESRLAWHNSNEVIVTRVGNRWFGLHYVKSGTLRSANIAHIDWLEIAAEPVFSGKS